ncbi:2288_t:CDS:2, partial [Scutellospora calospora]
LLMNLIENKCHFIPKITFTFGKEEPFFLVNINSNDDLKIYYIDSIIKNIFPKILFIYSQHSPEDLEKKVNDISFFNNRYSKKELALFFEQVPYFGIHQDISLIHLHKINITEFDQKEVFVINFNNIDLKH